MARRARRSARSTSRFQRWLLRWGWLLPVGALVIGATVLVLTYAFARIPLPRDIRLASSAEVFDVHGRRIGTYSGEVRRFLIDPAELPDYVGDAVVAAEDRDFYDHSGVSIRGIIRAAWANLTGGEITQGGSTITQQYVKNAVLRDPSRTVTRKLKELVLAIKLERRYSKAQILGFYLNTIYLGRGAYGFEAAARTYFDKPAVELTLGEAAYLAGIIPAPETYQPDENPGGARERRDRVLDVMVAEGYITEERAAVAKKEKVEVTKGALGSVVKRQPAAYFLEWLRRDFLYPEFGEELFTRGLKIYTTLDLGMQEAAEDAIAATLTEKGDPQAALVSMTPRGEVRALVGGRDFTNVRKARGFDFATDFPGRHAGSAFKPFTLLTAIDEDISTSSTFSGSSPRIITNPECSNPDGSLWDVENFGGSSYGVITLDQATTNSVNTVYAQLVGRIGPAPVRDTVEEFGFEPKHGEDEVAANCSLALGTLDVTPLEMTRAYAGFAGRGALPQAMPIRYIEDSQGECVKLYRPSRGADGCGDRDLVSRARVAEENSVDVLNQTLTHVVSGGTATAANIGRPVAGKTGTAQNHSNAWFAGYVPQLATVVWMGYPLEKTKEDPDGFIPLMEYCGDPKMCRPVHGITVTGGSFPAQIWAAFMSVATEGMEVLSFPVPSDLPDMVIRATPTARPTPKPTRRPGKPSPAPTESGPGSPAPAPSESEPGPLPSQSHRDEGG